LHQVFDVDFSIAITTNPDFEFSKRGTLIVVALAKPALFFGKILSANAAATAVADQKTVFNRFSF
jgi:hypothetical protein